MRGKPWVSWPMIAGSSPASASLPSAALTPRKPKSVKTSRPPGRRGAGALGNPWAGEAKPGAPAVVGGGHRVAPLAVGGRRHLGRARADEIEHEPADRLPPRAARA